MSKAKVIIIMPAYNVAPVLKKTVAAITPHSYDEIIVVDDGSKDTTAQVGRELGCTVIVHPQNRGYGGAQKTGYQEALKRNADLVVLVHGDNQYDPSLVSAFVDKIVQEKCDLVTGTRMILGDVLKQGMPIWKFIPNRFLTWLENTVFESHITDYHNGFRAYSAKFLSEIPLDLLSEKFDFDTDIIIQGAIRKYKIGEVPHPTRYNEENSQMPFSKGVVYGLSILRTVGLYILHKVGIYRQKIYIVKNNNL
ncbi:MAG: glycosyltransferase family 2 protein [Candidatus Omnitrophica bacterium]|nr:glycosyltransferase family 2 protein [Candidatus Omnitrophota bacterium]